MQTIKTDTAEIHDPYGGYGEARVTYSKLSLLTDGETYKVNNTLPDGRIIVEYEGNNSKEAETIFKMIAASSIPEILR